MCIAVPGELIDINCSQGKIDVMGVEMIINIQLIENPKVGDHVLVHAGCAIEKINKDYFDDLNAFLKSIIGRD